MNSEKSAKKKLLKPTNKAHSLTSSHTISQTEKPAQKKASKPKTKNHFMEKQPRPEGTTHKKLKPSRLLKEKISPSSLTVKERQELEEKLKKSLENNLYLRAEFENFKRRAGEEKIHLIRYGGESLIQSLANEVLDDLDRAMLSAEKEKSFENLKKGLEMIQKKLSQVLSRFGVETLDPKGKAFDPAYQEALSYIKTSDFPEGHVAETFKKAYKLHGKVIRPAQVVLAKKQESR